MATNSQRIRNLIADDKYLGKVFDNDPRWKRVYGVGECVVGSVRRNMGIPPKKRLGARKHPMRAAIAADPLLGKVADVRLAHRYGCSRHLIMNIRNGLGLVARTRADNAPDDFHIQHWRTEAMKRVGWC